MALGKNKPNHTGPKNGGGHWGNREDAKTISNKNRRADDKAKIVQGVQTNMADNTEQLVDFMQLLHSQKSKNSAIETMANVALDELENEIGKDKLDGFYQQLEEILGDKGKLTIDEMVAVIRSRSAAE